MIHLQSKHISQDHRRNDMEKKESSVVGDVSSNTSKFKWVIKNFCTGCKNVGDVLKSPEFSTLMSDGELTKWQLYLYPKSENDATKDFLSVQLKNLTHENITMNVAFAILNDKKEVAYEKVLGEKTFNKSLNWGVPKFLSHDQITNKTNGILKNDKLTIVCTISTDPIEDKNKDDKSATGPSERIKNKLRLLEFDEFERMITEDNGFSDVSLRSGKRTWNAHKCILAKRSPVFAKIFQEKTENNALNVGDVDPNVFMELLRFIYSGKIEDNEINMRELLVLADKFKLNRLFDMCEKTLSKDLNVDSIMDRIKIAHKYKALSLKKKAIDFFTSNVKDIVSKPEFKGLAEVPEVLCEVLHNMAMR